MINFKILYEDNHLIVVEKPINILSQKDKTNDLDFLTMVKEYLKYKYYKPGNVYVGLIHRLDRPVGGLMVFAKTSKAANRLNKQLQDSLFVKSYLAIVKGPLKKEQDILIDYLIKKETTTFVTTKEKGKLAKLEYKVLKRKNDLALIKINLLTGRHHQIRVQFASRGFPIYGDQKYGKQDKKPIALFANGLSFYHPITKELLTFEIKPEGEIWSL